MSLASPAWGERAPLRGARALVALLTLALLPALSGCVSPPPAEPERSSSVGPVVLVHGIWPDHVSWWTDELQTKLHERGVQTLPVGYSTFVFGYLTGLGTDAPARRLTETLRQMRVRHAQTACPAELHVSGVGFSAGTAVLTRSAEAGVTYERLYFAGSPIPAWSSWLAEQVRERRIGHLTNYYSLVDGVVNPLFGSGALGFHGGDADVETHVENRRHWRPHAFPVWSVEERADRLCAELVSASRGRPPHTCFDEHAFAAWFAESKRRLRSGLEPLPRGWRAPRYVARVR